MGVTDAHLNYYWTAALLADAPAKLATGPKSFENMIKFLPPNLPCRDIPAFLESANVCKPGSPMHQWASLGKRASLRTAAADRIVEHTSMDDSSTDFKVGAPGGSVCGPSECA